MADRIFVYIDGESHYIRSENTWRTLHGPDACLDRLRYIGQINNDLVLVVPEANVFWTRRLGAGVQRAVYFTSAVGSPEALHEVKLKLRGFDLEPHVISEAKKLEERRQNILRDSQIIEKPKGVDIALAVRMLEDSHNSFDVCHLYTSDVDFLPVIHAVRGRGKRVFVYGFKNGLGKTSELLTVPDLFVDLGEMLKTDCELVPVNAPSPSAG
jgi:uncharacterized LabA/DUF88 family protein